MTYNVFSGTLNPTQSTQNKTLPLPSTRQRDHRLEDKTIRTVLCCTVYGGYALMMRTYI